MEDLRFRRRNFRIRFLGAIMLCGTLVACGGNVRSDDGDAGASGAPASKSSGGQGGSGGATGGTAGSGGATGGTAGSGGVIGVSGGSSSGGAGGNAAPTCPADPPVGGSPCADLREGFACPYFTEVPCCDETASCLSGVWVWSGTCDLPPPLECPLQPPIAGSACGCEYEWGVCAYDCNGQHTIHALCDEGSWQVTTYPCSLPACDGLDFCACFDRTDCQVLSDGCICPCDYTCAGDPPCECTCGGGEYLGCAER